MVLSSYKNEESLLGSVYRAICARVYPVESLTRVLFS